MTSGWRWSMDNLRDAYYLVQLIARQILIFLQDFIFHEFAWFAPTEEAFGNANPKIRSVELQHVSSVADFVVILAICGLFAFVILSVNSPKDEASNYEMTRRIEAIPMAFEDETTSFWSSRPTNSQLITCHHTSSRDSSCPTIDSREIVETRKIMRPAMSKSNVSAAQPRLSEHNARFSHSQHSHTCAKAQTSRLVAQTAPRKLLVRRTRSGHIYGKYSV